MCPGFFSPLPPDKRRYTGDKSTNGAVKEKRRHRRFHFAIMRIGRKPGNKEIAGHDRSGIADGSPRKGNSKTSHVNHSVHKML